MKVKNLSKVLAFLVAVVMIFAALPIMANAADEAFVVSYAAPAIPMNENTKVDLKTLAVEMAAGTTVSGADVEWATDVTDGIVLDATKKTVEALAKGNYKLTATANGVTKNVWVMVKTVEETNFYLVNMPKIIDSFNSSDWVKMKYKANSVSALVDGDTAIDQNKYLKTPYGFGLIYVADDIFLDFADYTVQTKVSSTAANTVASSGAGTFARMTFDASNKYATGIISCFRQPGNIGVAKPTALTSSYAYCGTETGKVDGKYQTWKGWNDFHTVKSVHSGSVTTYYYDDMTTPRLISTNASNYPAAGQTSAGYPGIEVYDSTVYIQDFYVYLNSNDMPAVMVDEPEPEADIVIVGEGTAEVEAVVGSDNTYTVELAPAEGYKVKLGSLYINGEAVLGSDTTGRVYTFATEDLDNTTIAVEYIEDNGQFNTIMLGAQVNPTKSGIRFGSRTDSIKRAAENANAGLLDNRLYVDGVTYEIDEIGMILVPSQLLKGEDLTVGGKYVVRQPVSKIVGLTDDFADIAITLTGIPESQFGVKISSRMYVAYTDGDGATQYIYTEIIERSYNDVLDAMSK